MARIDSLDILCSRQVVDKIEYSDFAKDLGTPRDWGVGLDQYVQVSADGAFSTGNTVEVQLIGAPQHQDGSIDVDKGVVISSTGAIPKAEVKVGWKRFLPINPVGVKYQYLYLKFLPAAGAEEQDVVKPTNPCPIAPMLKPEKELANGFTSFIVFQTSYDTNYITTRDVAI